MKSANTIYYHQPSESIGSRLLKMLMVVMRLKNNLPNQLAKLDQIKNDAAPIPKSIYKQCNIKEEVFEGKKLWTMSPKTGTSNKVIFHVHGGGYVFNLSNVHWPFLSNIVQATNATIVVSNYPLAPQQTIDKAYTYLHKLYEQTLERYANKEILIMGDSAGGGLAIAFAQYLNEVNLPQPEQVIGLSPWLDVTMSNPNIKQVEPIDKALDTNSLIEAGKLYAGNISTKDYKISPIYGRFDNIAKVSIFMGANEIFVPDSRKLKDRLEKEGTPFNYYEYPNMFHCWMLMPPLKEAKASFKQIVGLINA